MGITYEKNWLNCTSPNDACWPIPRAPGWPAPAAPAAGKGPEVGKGRWIKLTTVVVRASSLFGPGRLLTHDSGSVVSKPLAHFDNADDVDHLPSDKM
jgi:hypothetical protein